MWDRKGQKKKKNQAIVLRRSRRVSFCLIVSAAFATLSRSDKSSGTQTNFPLSSEGISA